MFAAVPAAFSGDIRWAARQASYGWGMVPVTATLGPVEFITSLFPRGGDYLLPLKQAVQRRAEIAPGDTIGVALKIYPATAVTK